MPPEANAGNCAGDNGCVQPHCTPSRHYQNKNELEDRSLKYLDPIGYDEIITALESTSVTREDLINAIKTRLGQRFEELGLKNVYIEGRVKHIYSIYRKMFLQNKTIDEVYDLYAIRVIVDTKEDCYNILGIIHDMYKPIPGRFKDYISTPKPNMYQSLHTTLIGRMGIPFEVQIRTWEMHHVAEYGVAAHWKYKEGSENTDAEYEEKLGWIRRMIETQQDTDAEDFLSNFKTDMFADEVYVFTPKGDVINLPAGASAIDFAYAIHSKSEQDGRRESQQPDCAHRQRASKRGHCRNHNLEGFKGPSRDWLKIAKTSAARSKIRQGDKKERREENIEQGGESLERELRRFGISLNEAEKLDIMPAVLKKLSFNNIEDLCAAIGYGGITVQRTVNRIREEYARRVKSVSLQPDAADIATQVEIRRSESGVIVEGLNSCLIKFAHCCTPVPGDEITAL